METRFLSHFSPSLMPPEALEAIFVQREELLCNILERIGISALTPAKHHTLLVGPRGIGKTHLISMVYYRLQAMEELSGHILVAWLREEEWGVSSSRDLILSILRALLAEAPDDKESARRLTSLYALEPDKVEAAAVDWIRELAGQRTLVILAENIDELFQKLGSAGQIQFHRFLREALPCCVIATSPGPASRIFPPGSPFQKGFFHIEPLSELSLEDAIRLVSKIADYQGDKELLSFIATPQGRARVRALRYLAGGNHRAYVIFAPLLAWESMDELIKPLMETVDDLTPYYTSRIAALQPEQRKIIEYICENRHPVSVEDVARTCFLTTARAAAQLEILCRMSHLQSLKLKETHYYELREPLMRLSFEVKRNRGKPIGLLIDFLRLWYSPAQLKQKMAALPERNAPGPTVWPDIQALEKDWQDPRVADCCREYNLYARENDGERALEAAAELAAIRGSKQDLVAQGFWLTRLGRWDQAAAVYERLTAMEPKDPGAWLLRARSLERSGRFEEALACCRKSLEIDPDSAPNWSCQASVFLRLARPDDALRSCEAAIRLDGAFAEAWTTRGAAFADLELYEEALEAFSKAVLLEPRNATARMNLSATLIELRRFDDALEQAARVLEIHPEEPGAWVLQGTALHGKGDYQESLRCFQKALSLGENSAFVRFRVGELLLALDRWREGAEYLDKTLGDFARSENPAGGDARALIRHLLPNMFAPRILQLSIKVLLLIYRKHRLLGALGQGLLECIPDILSADGLSDADASLWLDSWRMTAEPFPEFRLPLRLLGSAVRYRKTQDLGILMDLPQEERKLLEPLLGAHIEAIA